MRIGDEVARAGTPSAGLEPATNGLGNRCSIHLSYEGSTAPTEGTSAKPLKLRGMGRSCHGRASTPGAPGGLGRPPPRLPRRSARRCAHGGDARSNPAASGGGRWSTANAVAAATGHGPILCTRATDAPGGPAARAARIASRASGGPSSATATDPPARLHVHPATPSSVARRRTKARYPTPWTRPSTSRSSPRPSRASAAAPGTVSWPTPGRRAAGRTGPEGGRRGRGSAPSG